MPGLQLLAEGTPELQKETLSQFVPLVQLVQQNFPGDGYKACATTIMPILEKSLYSDNQEIRDKAVSII